MKPALAGVITRNGIPAGGGASYVTGVGGWVVKGNSGDGSAVSWFELQTSLAMNNAGTLVANNPIDQAITQIRTYNTANGTSLGLKVRVHAGYRSPVFVGGDPHQSPPAGPAGGPAPTGLDGVASFFTTDPQFGGGGWCPPFWLPNFQAAHRRFEAAMVAKYDSVPELLEIMFAANMTIYNEPFLRQIGGAGTQQAAMWAKGYFAEGVAAERQTGTYVGGGPGTGGVWTPDGVLNSTTTLTSASATFVAGDVGSIVIGTGIPQGTTIASRTNATTVVMSHAALISSAGVTVTIMGGGTVSDQSQQLDDISQRYIGTGTWAAPAGWQLTRVGYDYNPYQGITSATVNYNDPVNAATSFTLIAINHAAAVLGTQQFAPNNSSYRVNYLSGSGAYQRMYAAMAATGCLSGIQTAANVANIDGATGQATGRLHGQTTLAAIMNDTAANGLARTIAGAGLLVNAGSVEVDEMWWPGANPLYAFDTTVADFAILGALLPTASVVSGSGSVRQHFKVPSTASGTVLSVPFPMATLAGSTIAVHVFTRGAAATTSVALTGAGSFTNRTFKSAASGTVFGLHATYDQIGAGAQAGPLTVTVAPTGSIEVEVWEVAGSGIAYEGSNAVNAATTAVSIPYTTTHAGDVVLASFGWDNSIATISGVTSAFTNEAPCDGVAATLNSTLQSGYNASVATGALTYGGTLSAGIQWAGAITAYSITGGAVPGTPTSVVGTPGNLQATVTFTAPYNGGSVITSTLIKTYLAGVYQAGLDQTISGTGTSKVVTGLTNGTAYRSSATCTNANGAGPESALSGAYTPATPNTAPSTPAAPTGIALDGEVVWNWVAPNNGGVVIDEYGVDVSGYAEVIVNDGPPPSTSADITGYTDGVALTATVRAHNSLGWSSLSPSSAAVTPLAPTAPPSSSTQIPPPTSSLAHPRISARWAGVLEGP